MSRYVAFDVETPNTQNNRISSIGIAVIENGIITKKFHTFVDPETYFSKVNIAITQITPRTVKGSPNFGSVWQTIFPIMNSGVLIAHNAAFDMRVLAKCLRDYNQLETGFERYKKYICTVQMGKKCYPDLENHKLNTMCEHLGIELDHHRADSDSLACARLLIDYMDNGLDPDKFIRVYDFQNQTTVKKILIYSQRQ